jgi:hypothetical protein
MDDFDAGTDARRVCSPVIGRTGGGHIPRRGEPGYAKKKRRGSESGDPKPRLRSNLVLDYVM